MKNKEREKLPPLQEALLRAMQALDRQIAREMQRSPAQLEEHGTLKWEPYQKRVEILTSFVLDTLGAQQGDLDGLIVLSQAFTKALQLLVEDLGAEGLGKVRSTYCLSTLKNIERDARRALQFLEDERLPERHQ